MARNPEQLLSYVQIPEPPAGLFDVIMLRIEQERILAARRRLVVFAVCFAGSLLALIPTFFVMRAGIAQSGFAEFFSLLFSDADAIVISWRSFMLTLLESLPAVSIAAFLATVFASLGSLRFLTRTLHSLYGH